MYGGVQKWPISVVDGRSILGKKGDFFFLSCVPPPPFLSCLAIGLLLTNCSMKSSSYVYFSIFSIANEERGKGRRDREKGRRLDNARNITLYGGGLLVKIVVVA